MTDVAARFLGTVIDRLTGKPLMSLTGR